MSVKSLVVLFAFFVTVAVAGPALKNNYIEQENSCREVCGLCACDGFYCEDECICECNLEEDENLQCIADMKKECDANGLEYELVMQESAKERFMREVKGTSTDFNKHLVILKQKRQSATNAPATSTTAEPIVAAPVPSEPEQVAAAPESAPSNDENHVGVPLKNLASTIGGRAASNRKAALNRLTSSKLLVMLRQHLTSIAPVSTFPPITLPKITITTPAPYRFSLPTYGPVQPLNLFSHGKN